MTSKKKLTTTICGEIRKVQLAKRVQYFWNGVTNRNRAISPVIGVILMVAITVILAAVIGSFVLGFGDQIQETSPNTQFSFDNTGDTLIVTHEGGDPIPADQLRFVSSNTDDDWHDQNWSELSEGEDDTITAGNSVNEEFDDGETLRLVWEAEDGSSSATVATFES